jgi:hypothetical protein
MKPGSSRRRYAAIVILGVVGVCALTPAFASAQTVPPGSSEGDQYFEEIPSGGGSGSPEKGGGASGGGASGGGASGGGASGGGASSGSQDVAAAQALRAKGADGAAAADLANANRPPIGTKNQGNEPASSSTEGEGGMGPLLPILIAVTALAAIAYGIRRRMSPA